MTSPFHFRLWLLIVGVVVVLVCRGFKGSPGKSPADPKATKTEVKDNPSLVSERGRPPTGP